MAVVHRTARLAPFTALSVGTPTHSKTCGCILGITPDSRQVNLRGQRALPSTGPVPIQRHFGPADGLAPRSSARRMSTPGEQFSELPMNSVAGRYFAAQLRPRRYARLRLGGRILTRRDRGHIHRRFARRPRPTSGAEDPSAESAKRRRSNHNDDTPRVAGAESG
jgi:hypothetical protein